MDLMQKLGRVDKPILPKMDWTRPYAKDEVLGDDVVEPQNQILAMSLAQASKEDFKQVGYALFKIFAGQVAIYREHCRYPLPGIRQDQMSDDEAPEPELPDQTAKLLYRVQALETRVENHIKSAKNHTQNLRFRTDKHQFKLNLLADATGVVDSPAWGLVKPKKGRRNRDSKKSSQ